MGGNGANAHPPFVKNMNFHDSFAGNHTHSLSESEDEPQAQNCAAAVGHYFIAANRYRSWCLK